MRNKIAIATGGSGGHVFPALALCEQLNHRNVDYFILADQRVCHLLQDNSHRTYILNIKSSYGLPHKKISSIFSILFAIKKIKIILKKEKPDALISFGSYASIPSVLAARSLKIPIIMHEQNTVLGRAHHFLLKKTTIVATAFPEVEHLPKQKMLYVGNPIRSSITKLYNTDYYIDPDKPYNILVLGGSQGSNEVDMLASEAITEAAKYFKINVAHQCRLENIKQITTLYESTGIASNTSHFFDDMDVKLQEAHIIICRAGATTIMENLVAGRPAIYIPHNYSYRDHQLKNAVFIERNGAGIAYKAIFDSLTHIIQNLLKTPQKLHIMSQRCKQIAMPIASAKLAEIVLKYSRTKIEEKIHS